MTMCGIKYGEKWVICPTKCEQMGRESVTIDSHRSEFVPSVSIANLRCEPFSRYFVVESSVFVPRNDISSSSFPKDESLFDRPSLNKRNNKNKRIGERNLLIMKKNFSFRGTDSDETGHFWNKTGLHSPLFVTFSARLGQKRSRVGVM